MVSEWGEHDEEKKDTGWEVWAHQLCRECGHYTYLHVLDYATNSYTVGACNYIGKEGFCFCGEYMPPDNLDYVELLAKRKGLIPPDKKGKK